MIKRISVEKRKPFNVEAIAMLNDLRQTLHIESLTGLRIINVYDIEGVNEEKIEEIKSLVLSEPNVDDVTDGNVHIPASNIAFRIELLPGQYDQRADSAAQCIEIITLENRPDIISSRIIILEGSVSSEEISLVKTYLINPVEAREVSLEVPKSLKLEANTPDSVEIVNGFTDYTEDKIEEYRQNMGFAMTSADILFIQSYFRDTEKRNPTITELKAIDTYWSDHCRHTTFLTALEDVNFEEGLISKRIREAYNSYLEDRARLYADKPRDISLMDLATINMKTLRANGGLSDLDVSDEINACSIEIPVKVDGKIEPWLLMFKNETHNHPTEIEPFGGAATCLGGAIRDPLSGRSYVYHSMRVTGAADPTVPFEDTLDGKLPQKIITQKAAAGFSSYGNQIGLATGLVSEVYDDGFLAKRMEVGAVVGAAPKKNVVRKKPEAGDVILLVGGRTGRDGVGGATGSSKEHDEESLLTCGAEVQKGNAPEERKIQRLFRRPEAATLIKKCNDFGAGGISVAIGELAESLEVDLDAVKKKYEGLDGTEIAISESQERMAVVLSKDDVETFISYCAEENLEASKVAVVTDSGRLVMKWKGQNVIDLSREFLDTNGVKGKASIFVKEPEKSNVFSKSINKSEDTSNGLYELFKETLRDLNVCSQKGLIERFDNTIGAGTVLMPFGGKTHSTPIQTMVAKLPVLNGETDTVSMMSYGYDPSIGKWSPYHGGYYSVVESIAKIVATGGNYKNVRLSLQEYFEKLGNDPVKWGKPFSSLLGASQAQTMFETAAIGGKDSMSGTFKDINVPPTLISFAVTAADGAQIISPEFKEAGNKLIYLYADRDEAQLLNIEKLKRAYEVINEGIVNGEIAAAYSIGKGGLCSAISKMSFGNEIGATIKTDKDLFEAAYGSIIMEIRNEAALDKYSVNLGFEVIGGTLSEFKLQIGEEILDMKSLKDDWSSTLEGIFPIIHEDSGECQTISYKEKNILKSSFKVAKPKVLIPAFPGTNCEWDTQIAFEKAGAIANPFLFKNLNPKATRDSIDELVQKINESQIIAFPGGFSAGDEPEGSGKFIASVFRNPRVAEALMKLLNERDGLVIGICNGFQALVKLGLLPYGEVRELDQTSPTLTFNKIGRHVARMARVRVASEKSPWLSNVNVGDVFETAFSHGEGRFYAEGKILDEIIEKGQIATQYVDLSDKAAYDGQYNINGSTLAIEGITSPDGRVFGKMGHVERVGRHLYKNVYVKQDMKIFDAGVKYFKF